MVVLGSAYMIGNRVHNLWFRAASVAAVAYLPLAVGVIRAQPVKGYDVKYYNATIRLDRAADSIFGDVTMGAHADSAITSVLQFAKYLTIDSVYIMGGVRSSISWIDTSTGQYVVAFPSAIAPGTAFSVRTFYHGKGTPEPDSWSWGGVTDKDTMMFSMGVGFEVPYTSCTRYWLPCYDLPDDEADSVDLTFITPPGDITASNGILLSNNVTPGGPWGAERIMHWHESHPIATYLLTFASGP